MPGTSSWSRPECLSHFSFYASDLANDWKLIGISELQVSESRAASDGRILLEGFSSSLDRRPRKVKGRDRKEK